MVKKESSSPIKHENQLRIIEPNDYALMNPSSGVLSKTDQPKTVQDLLKPKS